MMTPKQLYRMISADFKDEKQYIIAERGMGMMQAWEKDRERFFIINNDTKEAWECLSPDNCFSLWNQSAIEFASLFKMPKTARYNGMLMHAQYFFGIDDFRDGVAGVAWTLQPDGRYYADEDGFGMENQNEIMFYAFIDRSANIIIPFQEMDRDLMERYREQAVNIINNPKDFHYICLNPELTLPYSENTRLDDHKDKLRNIVRGLMIRFGAMVLKQTELNNNNEIKLRTALNPNPEHYLEHSLIATPVKGSMGKYRIVSATGLIKPGEYPQGYYTGMGELSTMQIARLVELEDNVEIILNDIIESSKMIYGITPQV